MTTGLDMQTIVHTAMEAARRAGSLIRDRFGRIQRVEFKGNLKDLVTEVDREAERLIVETLKTQFPDWAVLGEEASAEATKAGVAIEPPAGMCWVVDPLDGTSNYVAGIPVVCVSIALYADGEPVVGVVYDPLKDELFHATRSGGAFLNGEPIRVSDLDDLRRCIVATGTAVARYGEWPDLLRDISVLGPATATTRFLGAAALHLAYVACGRVHVFWERRLSPWDMAAGALLVTEAGGRVSEPGGGPYTLKSHSILATNRGLYDTVRDLLSGRDMLSGYVNSRDEVLALLRQLGVYREGHFLLTSGRHSPAFFLFSQAFSYPAQAERLGRAVASLFSDERVETVIGPAMGGVILAHEVARALGVRSIYAEKADGGMVLKRGFTLQPGERVLIVEDAVTTGGSVRKVLDTVRATGATVLGVGAVVDRSSGGNPFDVDFRSLLRMEVPSYEPQDCPLCQEGVPLISPKASG